MDYFILKEINKFAGKNLFLDIFGLIIADYLIFFLPIVIFAVYFLYKKRKNIIPLSIKIILTLVLAFILNYFLSQSIARPRPFFDYQDIYQLSKFFTSQTDYAFPSYHVMVAFVLSFAVLFDWRKFGVILIVFSFLIGIGRVFCGIHYLSDIFGGIIIAFFSFLIVNFFLNKNKKWKLLNNF